MRLVIKGSNLLLNRPLLQSDGETPIPVSSLAAAQVELIQKGETKRTLVFGTDPELQAGADGNSFDLELTAEITDALARGVVTERWTIEIVDPEYIVDGDEIRKVDIQEVVIGA